DRSPRHQADAYRTDDRRGGVRAHAGLRRYRAQPRSCGRCRGRPSAGGAPRPRRRALYPRRREFESRRDSRPHRGAGGPQAAAALAADPGDLADRARRRGGGPDHRARAFRHARWAAHGAAQDVFLVGQGKARAGLCATLGRSGARRCGRLVPSGGDVPMSLLASIAALSLAAWLYLLFARGFFWLPVWPAPVPPPARWPSVAVVVPARNEAAVVGEALASLLTQQYPGRFSVARVDVNNTDGTSLVARLEAEQRDMVSQMVLLRCRSLAERFLIPAFVFFFAMLYPFAWSNDRRQRTAAAAGGCILLRRSAYRRIGGFAAMRGALIDDCALAKAVKES